MARTCRHFLALLSNENIIQHHIFSSFQFFAQSAQNCSHMNPLNDLYRLITVDSSCSRGPTSKQSLLLFLQTPNSLSTPVARTREHRRKRSDPASQPNANKPNFFWRSSGQPRAEPSQLISWSERAFFRNDPRWPWKKAFLGAQD